MKKKLTRKQRAEIQKRSRELNQRKLNFKLGISLLIAGLILLSFFGSIWLYRDKPFQNDEMTQIEGTVNQEIFKKWNTRGYRYIDIKLNEYPNTYFHAGSLRANLINVYSLNESLESNKKIFLTILKNQANKLNSSSENKITIFGIEHNGNSFLSLNKINKAMKKNRNSIASYALIAFSFWSIIYGIKVIVNNRNLLATNSHSNIG